jgi:hypothetical protein
MGGKDANMQDMAMKSQCCAVGLLMHVCCVRAVCVCVYNVCVCAMWQHSQLLCPPPLTHTHTHAHTRTRHTYTHIYPFTQHVHALLYNSVVYCTTVKTTHIMRPFFWQEARRAGIFGMTSFGVTFRPEPAKCVGSR